MRKLALIIIGIASFAHFAQAQDQGAGSQQSIEERKLAIEYRKLDIEEQQLLMQRQKMYVDAASVAVPLLIGALTLALGLLNMRKTAQNQFAVKAAEIALNTKDPYEARNKARALVALFKRELPADFVKRIENFEPENYNVRTFPGKARLIELIAAQPDHRAQIIADWKAMFPSDDWVKVL